MHARRMGVAGWRGGPRTFAAGGKNPRAATDLRVVYENVFRTRKLCKFAAASAVADLEKISAPSGLDACVRSVLMALAV